MNNSCNNIEYIKMTNVSENRLEKYNKHNREIWIKNKTGKSKLIKILQLFNSWEKRKIIYIWKRKENYCIYFNFCFNIYIQKQNNIACYNF